MKFGFAVLAMAVLAGCQTQQIHEMNYSERRELAAQIVQRCIDQGVNPESQEMSVCTAAEVQAENSKRQNNLAQARRSQMALSQGMQNAGRSYSQASTANRLVNCRSVRAPDGAVRTTCN